MRPYVIVAPGYSERSWGVRTLHLLCHELNQLGVPATMLLGGTQVTNPRWHTPRATRGQVREGIVVYPEVIDDNFLRSRRVVRWLLNRPGYINGKSIAYGREDYVVTFSAMIDDSKPVLNLQTANEGLFHPHDSPPRDTELFFVGKGDRAARVPALEAGRMELTRDWSSHAEYAALLRRSRLIVSYDTLTGVNYEAALCGTLCIVVPNGPYTREDIAKGELGLNGIAWGTDPAEIARARATLPEAFPQYLKVVARQPDGIHAFVGATQDRW